MSLGTTFNVSIFPPCCFYSSSKLTSVRKAHLTQKHQAIFLHINWSSTPLDVKWDILRIYFGVINTGAEIGHTSDFGVTDVGKSPNPKLFKMEKQYLCPICQMVVNQQLVSLLEN